MLAHHDQNFSHHPVAIRWRRWLAALGVSAGLALGAAPAVSGWTAAIKPDPLTRQPRCLLSSERQVLADGYEQTPVSLVFDGASLLVITESELDSSFSDLQLVVNNNPPHRSDKIARKMILVFDQDLPELLRQLREERLATVYLRFWPTWPATQSYPVNFSLIGFKKAHDAFTQGCLPAAGSSPASG